MEKKLETGVITITKLEDMKEAEISTPLDDSYLVGLVNVSNWTAVSFKGRTGASATINVKRNCFNTPQACVKAGTFAVILTTNCHESSFGITFHLEHPYGYQGDTNVVTITPDCGSLGQVITLDIPDPPKP